MSSTCPDRDDPRTRVIAHRGASGYLPEHTIAAKALAYGMGADILEQDVVATRDQALVVLHDIHLNDVSDVADRFPGRQRGDGRFYVIDFSLTELAQLTLAERRIPGQSALRFPARFPFASPEFRIVPLEDEIRWIGGLNVTTGRRVGIYPEIKEPSWHEQAGIDICRLVHEALDRQREFITGPGFVQSFSASALRRLRDAFGSDWPRIQLLEADDAALSGNRAALAAIAEYAVGVGVPYESLIAVSADGRLTASPLAGRLMDAGLLLHPYTLRRDERPPTGIDYLAALRFLIHELAVDAIFCDQPDDALGVRDGSAA